MKKQNSNDGVYLRVASGTSVRQECMASLNTSSAVVAKNGVLQKIYPDLLALQAYNAPLRMYNQEVQKEAKKILASPFTRKFRLMDSFSRAARGVANFVITSCRAIGMVGVGYMTYSGANLMGEFTNPNVIIVSAATLNLLAYFKARSAADQLLDKVAYKVDAAATKYAGGPRNLCAKRNFEEALRRTQTHGASGAISNESAEGLVRAYRAVSAVKAYEGRLSLAPHTSEDGALAIGDEGNFCAQVNTSFDQACSLEGQKPRNY